MERPYDIQSLESLTKGRFSIAARVRLLWKGEESFRIICDAIEEAERLVCLQFYIFRSDDTGTALGELLKRKSREGIQVCLLYDHFGSLGTPRRFWREMMRAGVRVRASHPFKWNDPFHYVHRDHRKLIIIDSKKAFTGGLNVANEYMGFNLRRRGRVWRDTGVMLEGPIVNELLDTFKRSWYTWKGEKIDVSEEGKAAAPRERKESICLTSTAEGRGSGGVPALPIFVYSVRGRRRMRTLLRYSIDHAQTSIMLTTAYFIPSRRLRSSLERAVKRGARVRLLVPGKSDVPAASFAGRAFFSRLLNAGVEIYTYRGEMLHAKTYVFDQYWSLIGSTNLDYQSLMYNDEGNVGILDETFGAKLTEIFEEDLRNAKRIEPETWQRRPIFDKIWEHLFALFRKRL